VSREVAGLVFIDPTDFMQTDADMAAVWEKVGVKNGRDSIRTLSAKMLTGMPAGVLAMATPHPELDRFVGQYPFTPNFAITITRDDDKLMLQATGQQAFALAAESATTFTLQMVGAKIEFETDAAGNATAVGARAERNAPARTKSEMRCLALRSSLRAAKAEPGHPHRRASTVSRTTPPTTSERTITRR
jgi:hypothetical protein